jgi:hypothetical protein
MAIDQELTLLGGILTELKNISASLQTLAKVAMAEHPELFKGQPIQTQKR